MDFRNLSQEYRITSERGFVLFTAMMLLVLMSGLAFFILQNAATEMQISSESNKAVVHTYTAESAIEQTLAWFNNPAQSPNVSFFSKNPCTKSDKKQEVVFSYFIDDIAEKVDFRFKRPSTQRDKDKVDENDCLVEVTAVSGKGMSIALSKNPMPPIPNGMAAPATIDKKQDEQLRKVKRFVKRYGRYLALSQQGNLIENGVDIGTFDAVFANKNSGLVFIDIMESHTSLNPLKIGKGSYKGYFYFAGDIKIEGDQETVPGLGLVGFFYTQGSMILDNQFSVYGALYAGSGFEGDGISQDNITYNQDYITYNEVYADGLFKGVLPVVPIIGTQRTM